MTGMNVDEWSLEVQRFAQRFGETDWPADLVVDGKGSDYWSDRACGLACLRMVFAHFRRPVPTQLELLKQCLAAGAYTPHGWSHAGLAQVATQHGVFAQARAMSVAEMPTLLRSAGPLVVSVTHRFPLDGRRGGHLVVVKGRRSRPQPVIEFCDPSRWGAQHDHVPETRFSASYAGRGVVFGLSPA